MEHIASIRQTGRRNLYHVTLANGQTGIFSGDELSRRGIEPGPGGEGRPMPSSQMSGFSDWAPSMFSAIGKTATSVFGGGGDGDNIGQEEINDAVSTTNENWKQRMNEYRREQERLRQQQQQQFQRKLAAQKRSQTTTLMLLGGASVIGIGAAVYLSD